MSAHCLIFVCTFCAVSVSQAQFPLRTSTKLSEQTAAVSKPGEPARGGDSTSHQKMPDQLEYLERLLDSSIRQEKISALELLKRVAPNERLKARVKEIAEQKEDAIVQGYARLLAADWGIPIRQPVAPPIDFESFNRNSTLDGSGIASSAPDAIDIRFGDHSDLPAGLPPQSSPTDQGKVGTALPRQAIEIAMSFSDSGVAAKETFADRDVAQPSFLIPQTPFWESNSAFNKSVPADSEIAQNLQTKPRAIDNWSAESNASDAFSKMSDATISDEKISPGILERFIDEPGDPRLEFDGSRVLQAGFLSYDREAPLGFTGPSGVIPTEFQSSDHFVPIEDRWRLGFPKWDRYGKGHPRGTDYPYQEGSLWDPYNQNVLKGDFPVIGQHTFFSMTAQSLAIHEYRQTPTATTPFESTRHPFSAGFFGNPDQYFYSPYFRFTFDLFHGNEAFKPVDWKIRLMPIFNVNNLDVKELAVVHPDVRLGTNRLRDDFALEEWFLEAKLADIGPDYDFVSARVGSQFFVSDFRGFIFRDVNRAARIFGTRLANRDQFNLVWFDQAEKDTNSELNTFRDRHQNVVIANYYRQDFVFPGYIAQASFHYNHDKPSFTFDDNDNLVRPDPVGVFKKHEVNAYYLGVGGEGHIGRINVVNQLYLALGNDSANPIGGNEQQINAQMAALELSYDRDWIRFRTSYFFASGDDDPNDGEAEGFDTIVDDPIFAGGEFSYWQRQSIRLFGNNLVQRKSIVPNLRSNKAQGQSNFVNPGLHLFNFGMDLEITPKTRIISNANFLYFDETQVLETYTFQNNINREIGTDLSIGLEHRPRLNDNAIIVMGIATLIPDQGLKDLFGTQLPPELAALGVGNELRSETPKFTSGFVELVLTY